MKKSTNNSDPLSNKSLGCGLENNVMNITLNISTTTGGTFSVMVETRATVENLKKTIAKKLKVAKDRICLLHREREIQEGTVVENGLVDGSKLILIPNVETGLLAQRPENTVMQALESLNDSQVNDFLSGKTPLNLSMRLGDHMMLIQLQLSTVNPSSPTHPITRVKPFKSKVESRSACVNNDNKTIITESSSSSNGQLVLTSDKQHSTQTHYNQRQNLLLTNKEFENLRSIVNSLTNIKQNDEMTIENDSSLLEQSPIRSLSNLVSSPIKTTSIKSIPVTAKSRTSSIAATTNINDSIVINNDNANTSSHTNTVVTNTANRRICSDPITAKLTSCLCKRLNTNSNSTNSCDINCQLRQDRPKTTKLKSLLPRHSTLSDTTPIKTIEMKSLRSSLLHRTTNNPIAKSRYRHNFGTTYLRRSKSSDNIDRRTTVSDSSFASTSGKRNNSIKFKSTNHGTPDTLISSVSCTDTRALAEASRNLTQTLRKLSKEVFTSKVDLTQDNQMKSTNGSGAVIESMKNHGKGIYSGTFSGTLNPALQDRYGRPKRDISTVIHILNDLLSATPQYSRGARISFEPTTSKCRCCQSSENESCKCTNAIVTKSNCTYGECNGHTPIEMLHGPFCDKHKPVGDEEPMTTEPLSTPTKCHCAARKTSNCTQQNGDESSECQCQFRSFDPMSLEKNVSITMATNNTIQSTGQVCIKCNSIELENTKTKNKLEQLRLVMQQKKERREARKLRLTPYASSNGGRLLSNATQTSSLNNSANTIATMPSPNDVVSAAAKATTSNHIGEEVDTAA